MNQLNESINWLESQALTMQYGVIALSAIIHAGKIVRIERSATLKIQIDDEKVAKCKQD